MPCLDIQFLRNIDNELVLRIDYMLDMKFILKSKEMENIHLKLKYKRLDKN